MSISNLENQTTPTLFTAQYPFSQTVNPNPSYAQRKRRQAGRRPNTAPFVPAPPPVPPQNFDMSDDIIVINKDSTAEAITALSVGFPADVLTEEEIDAGVVSVVGGIEQVNYILIRNHIITKWRENVFTWLKKEIFFNVVPSHCNKLLDSAYEYLNSRGYINFGVAREIKNKIPSEPSNKASVIIIGAGLAGLAAARQLMRFGFKVTVLEGRKRAGGRVYTRKLEGGNKTAAADLGGSVLTGTLGNPLGILARQLSSSLHKVRDKCPLYRRDGKPVDLDMDLKVENIFNRILDKASHLRQLMGEISRDVSLGSALETFGQEYGDAVNEEELNLFNWHLANLEYANAGLLRKLSLAFWDQDDPYDMGGDHCFLPGGNGRLVQALAENVPILYEKIVNTIRYSGNGVQVVAGTQVFEGDMALCTVPLGVLKSGCIKFVPELPQKKLDGIKRLGFGLLNKVAMLFPDVFWGTDLDTFGHLTADPSRRGEFFLFYSYATVAGGALLIALVAGEAAHTFESMHPTDAVTRVLQILRDIYEPQGITVPEPIQTVCTRWGNDPFSLGSYSNVAVGSSGDDYDILAENVGDGRVFFAGEATNRRYPATMHGAFLSGLREAEHMARYADVRTLTKKVEKKMLGDPYSQGSLLADLFREPDIEFGNYAIIYDRRNTDPQSLAVLRVTFDQQHSRKLLFQQLQSHFNQKREFHIYRLLPLEQALELREVRGGNDARLYFLTDKLGVNLIRRKGLGPDADSVISSIKAERGTRKYASTSLTLKSGLMRPKAASTKQKAVRRAKIVRSTNGASASQITKGAKPVGVAAVPLSLSNREVGSQVPTAGNLNGGNSGVSISHTVEKAKPVVTGVVSLSSPNQDLGSLIPNKEFFDCGTYPPSIGVGRIFAGNSSNSTAAVDTRPVDCLDGSGIVPLPSPNQDLGSSIPEKGETLDSGTCPPSIGMGDAENCSHSTAANDTRPMDCLDGSGVVSLPSPNQDLGSSIPKKRETLDSGTYPPSIGVVGDVGNSSNFTSAIDTHPMDCLDGSGVAPLSLPNQVLGSSIPKEGEIFDNGTYVPFVGVGDIFAGNSGNSTAAIDKRPMESIDGNGSVPLSSPNQDVGSSIPIEGEFFDNGTYVPFIGVDDIYAGNSGNFTAENDTRPMDCLDGNSFVPLSSPNQDVGSSIPKEGEIFDNGTPVPIVDVDDIFAGNSGNSTAANDTRPMDCLDGNSFVPLSSPNQDLGSLIPKEGEIFDNGTYVPFVDAGDIFAGNNGKSTAAHDTRPMDCLDGNGFDPVSSPNQDLESSIPKGGELFDNGTYVPFVDVDDIFAGNSGNSTAANDTRPMDCLDGNGFVHPSSPDQDLGSSVPKEGEIFDNGTHVPVVDVDDIFAGNSGKSTAANGTRPMDCLNGNGFVPPSSPNQDLGSLIPQKEGIFGSGTYPPSTCIRDIFAKCSGNANGTYTPSTCVRDIFVECSGNASAANDTHPMDWLDSSVPFPDTNLADPEMGEQPADGANISTPD